MFSASIGILITKQLILPIITKLEQRQSDFTNHYQKTMQAKNLTMMLILVMLLEI